jgi:hypothetical protein
MMKQMEQHRFRRATAKHFRKSSGIHDPDVGSCDLNVESIFPMNAPDFNTCSEEELWRYVAWHLEGDTALPGGRKGERTRHRVLFPAPSPETWLSRLGGWYPRFGVRPADQPTEREGALRDTRGRVCSPPRCIRSSQLPTTFSYTRSAAFTELLEHLTESENPD